MSEQVAHEPVIVTQQPIHRMQVTYLGPRGNVVPGQYVDVKTPTLEDATPHISLPGEFDEVAFINFRRYWRLNVNDEGEEYEAITRDKEYGDTFVATDWRDGEHVFSTAKSLLEEGKLPLYTLEWLARYTQVSALKRHTTAPFKGPDAIQALQRLPVWAPRIKVEKSDQPDMTMRILGQEALLERAQRLTYLLAARRPDLAERFEARGISPAKPIYRTRLLYSKQH